MLHKGFLAEIESVHCCSRNIPWALFWLYHTTYCLALFPYDLHFPRTRISFGWQRFLTKNHCCPLSSFSSEETSKHNTNPTNSTEASARSAHSRILLTIDIYLELYFEDKPAALIIRTFDPHRVNSCTTK